jgi:hypothetical protein
VARQRGETLDVIRLERPRAVHIPVLRILQMRLHGKVTKHYEWLQAKNYWFVPVVADTSGALHPETLRLLYDFARLKTDPAEQHAVANSLRSPLTPE